MKITIATLITCYNRREKTISCLKSLYDCKLPENHTLEIFLVDDGSSDGTKDAVNTNFPQVNVIQGNGNLFWNQGMHLAWNSASQTKDFDYYLWLNDDTLIFSNALQCSIKAANETNKNSIICGATKSNEGICTYSSFRRISKKKFERLSPNGELQHCEVFNGNFVLIPKYVYHTVGNLDSGFTHYLGDFDYGLRASKKGIHSYLMSEFIGYCEIGNSENKTNKKMNTFDRLKHLYSPLGNNPLQFFKYQFRHFGIITAVKYFISDHLKTILKG